MQQYECGRGDSFTESLDWIKDGYQYPTFIIRLCLAVFVLTDASLGTIQDIVTITLNERPSKQLLLIGPLTAGVLIGTTQMVAHLVGGNGLIGGQYVALVLVSAIIGIKAAGEVAMIRINGYDVLRRGSTNKTVIRYSLLLLPILASLALIGRFLTMMVQWGLESEPIILGLVSLVVLGLGWTATRTVQSYRQARNSTI
ncbi:hypothetical protein C450_20531 [Halococcus salifodinae DSM 8989]|uniref:Uncharacterized protein n=2 Tax=Halococcus salifodinae TaxID=36738 RepID=M0MTD8_9EURY|nr:hypothetical protein C450_20531 [Halococcus salifodinae DSM 8989]